MLIGYKTANKIIKKFQSRFDSNGYGSEWKKDGVLLPGGSKLGKDRKGRWVLKSYEPHGNDAKMIIDMIGGI